MSNSEIIDSSSAKPDIEIDVDTGWVKQARRVPSPNCDERPEGAGLELIVIHNISLPPGIYGGPHIDALFTNQLDPADHPYFAEIHQMRVSSHLLVRRDGSLVQYVPIHQRAWHAGLSCYQGRERCNDFSIGIELEGQDDEPYENAQYEALNGLTLALLKSYPGLSAERIAGHNDIAPGRKTDPGAAFDWSRYHLALSAESESK